MYHRFGHRLEQILLNSIRHAFLGVFEITVTGDDNDRDIAVCFIELLAELQAVHLGHFDIRKMKSGRAV